mgnify:CR=1 FL=1
MRNEEKQIRNYGIDFLRIISMIMIVSLHVLGHGGLIDGSEIYPVYNKAIWLMEILAYCAVNIYGIISGYVGYGRKHKYSSIIYLYFQVIFYTLPIAVLYMIKSKYVDFDMIKMAINPIQFNVYWYFTAYFSLFFFMPFLDIVLDRFSRFEMKNLIISVLIIFSILPTIFYTDYPETKNGYSFLWLASLYLLGGYMKKYNIIFSKKTCALGYSICVLFTWGMKFYINFINNRFSVFHDLKMEFVQYTSPTIVLCAVFVFQFFKNIKYRKWMIKFIAFFSPISFGVYLFHEEPLIREHFISGKFVDYLSKNFISCMLHIIITVIVIWLVGSLVDKIRLILFELLRIDQFSDWIEKKGYRLEKRIKKKFNRK